MPVHHTIGADMYVPRQTHSSPHVHGNMVAPLRSALGPDAKSSHSLPTFPTQPLMSQALPHMPGLGMPRQGQPLQPPMGTTFHTNLVIRPGMAYAPRFVRPPASPARSGRTGARHDPHWSPPEEWHALARAGGPPQSMRGGAPVWREHSPAPSQWAPGHSRLPVSGPPWRGRACSCVWESPL